MGVRRFTRWHAAGWVWRYAPDVRGRDRLFSLVLGTKVPASMHGLTDVRFGPGLRARVDLSADGSFMQVFLASYADPVLVPILEAVLGPGDCFWDVGANVGIYSLWASKLVGADGAVFAFEPVPTTRRWLTELVAQNEAQVSVEAVAVSDRDAIVHLATVAHASGLSHITNAEQPGDDDSGRADDVVEARSIRGDDFAREHRVPTLVKIDVEGHELAVVDGLHDTIEAAHPVVVFESPDTIGGSGGTTAEIIERFRAHGYDVWSLNPKGLEIHREETASHNLLALHAVDHLDVRDALRTTRFARSQNC